MGVTSEEAAKMYEPSSSSWFRGMRKDELKQTSAAPVGLIEASAPLAICIDPCWTLEIWVDPTSSCPFRTVLELQSTIGTLNRGPLDCSCPSGCSRLPDWPGRPARSHSADCVSALWSDVTLRRHYPHHCASLLLCTGNQLWQPWPSNLIGPVTRPDPLAIAMVLKFTIITTRPLDFCTDTRFNLLALVPRWLNFFASLLCILFVYFQVFD